MPNDQFNTLFGDVKPDNNFTEIQVKRFEPIFGSMNITEDKLSDLKAENRKHPLFDVLFGNLDKG